jgi:hypothetical protein
VIFATLSTAAVHVIGIFVFLALAAVSALVIEAIWRRGMRSY